MSRPLRVLCLTTLFPSSARPGFGLFVARQCAALAQRDDVELTVINPIARVPRPFNRLFESAADRAVPESEVWDGINVHRPRFSHAPRFGAPWNPGLIRRAVLPLARRLHAETPFDVVDAQFFYPDGPAAARIAAALGLPLSIKARGSDIHYWGGRGFARRRMLAAAKQAAGLLSVSEALKQDMAALGMAAEKITVHYTGLDHGLFFPRPRKQARADLAHLLPVNGPLVVTVGNLIPLKGQQLVVPLPNWLPGVHIVLAGKGPEEGALCNLASQLGLSSSVTFAGALPPAELATLLTAADAMVLPSEREGLANAWIEALACGTPLVITDVGGAREVVQSPTAGRLVERTTDAIAAAVRELLATPPSQADVAANAARFSWETNAAQLAEHYRLVAGLGPSRAIRS